MRTVRIITLVVLVVGFVLSTGVTLAYVGDGNCEATPNGSIWNANISNFHEIQCDCAQSGDTILMAPGVYHVGPLCAQYAVIYPRGRDIVYMKDPAQTGDVILSGRYHYYPYPDIVAFLPTCQIVNGEGNGCKLIGLTIRCGLAPDEIPESGEWSSGGPGIICAASSPIIRECNFVALEGSVQGIHILDPDDCSSPINVEINNCNFSGNLVSGSIGVDVRVECDLDSSVKITDCNIFNWGSSGINAWGNYGIELTGCNIKDNLDSGITLDLGTDMTNLTVSDCNINNNGIGMTTAPDQDGSITFRRCKITNNSGGGIYAGYEYSTLEDCIIKNNSGTGIWANFLDLERCVIEDNTGGGVWSLVLDANRCIIRGNSTETSGGGITVAFNGISSNIAHCIISGNHAGGSGGGLALYAYENHGSANIVNCIISGNHAGYSGGGLFLYGSDSSFFNCTIVGNDANLAGGGAALAGDIDVTNCIFWANVDNSQMGGQYSIHNQIYLDEIWWYFTNVKIRNCDIQDTVAYGNFVYDELTPNDDVNVIGRDLGGNIDANPLFTDEYHIDFGSPCINAGDNNIINWSYDIDDQNRIIDGIVDIGADEFFSCLIGWWKFDEGTGTIAYDSKGDNDGNLINGPTWTTGQIDGALSFDGVNDYVELPNNTPVWLPESDFTASAWVYFDTDPASRPHDFILGLDFTYYDNHESCTGIALFRNGNDGKAVFQIETTNTTDALASNDVLQKNRWYHVVIVRQGTTQSVYLDGSLNSSRSCSGNPIKFAGTCNDDKVNIGRTSELCWSPPYYLDGMIDDVRLYDCALSAEEVKQLYESVFRQGECFPVTYSTYNDWVEVGKPNCWCGQRGDPQWNFQCYGDADNKTQGMSKYRVYNSDYTYLQASWALKATQMLNNPDPNVTICADFDHKAQGMSKYRVYNSDYNILMTNWTKKDTQLQPWCPLGQ